MRWLPRGGVWWCLALALALAACSSRAPDAARASMGADATATVNSAPPQLGTRWGEGRESRVQNVNARRLNEDRPDAQAVIAYNSAAAVRSALGRHPDRQFNVQLADGDVEWSVRDSRNEPLALQRASENGRLLVAGSEGDRYVLVFRNLSDRAYEVVATVDGLSVMNGQPGSLRQSGYVLRPGALLRIEGFRKSDAEVAAFRFSAPERAYAANTPAGDARNIGVLGAALFELALPGEPAAPRRTGARAPNAFPADGTSLHAPPPRYPAGR